jgi:hypothetical protein
MEKEAKETPYKYEIGECVLQRNSDGDLEDTIITGRTRINGNNVYTTELIGKWESETFIKK